MIEKRPPVLHLKEGFRHFNASFCGLGGKVMGDPNKPLVDEVHRPEPLGNCRKSAAQFLGQLASGNKWIGEDQLMKSFLINRAGAAGGKILLLIGSPFLNFWLY